MWVNYWVSTGPYGRGRVWISKGGSALYAVIPSESSWMIPGTYEGD